MAHFNGASIMAERFNRRQFIEGAAAFGGLLGASNLLAADAAPPRADAAARTCEPLRPIGEAKGIFPGRVAWVHDPQVLNWQGPGDGRWYQADRLKQDRADEMLLRAVTAITGETKASPAWNKLFHHFNKTSGRGDVGYTAGEKIVVKPNWVGMIWREGHVDPKTYRFRSRPDYMNTAPQMILAVLRQLTAVGVRPSDITVSDSLAYLVHEYYDILHGEFSDAQYVDYAGQFGRIKVQPSSVPLYWSCRPQGKMPDYVPTCFVEASYVINFANLKAHGSTGVTLCGKNHFGSLVRWPVQEKYYDMHRGSFSQQTQVYREHVDLMGHAHLGGKTVLSLIDGLFSGVHPQDPLPQKFRLPPFGGNWPSSLLASQDPVAIDSVGFDFLRGEFEHPRRPGVDDYLHEAALAAAPPSGTFYDPHHAAAEVRLASLGVHEHWNNARERKYSRNLHSGDGIELVAEKCG
jgi:hypothetical protein